MKRMNNSAKRIALPVSASPVNISFDMLDVNWFTDVQW